MKKLDGSIIPIEPDNDKALARVLKQGGQAKVKVVGSDRLFIMQKCEKSSDYELLEAIESASGEQLREALHAAKKKIK